jgi:hypothetical protein
MLEDKEIVVKQNYVLLDELLSFLDQEEVLPILCGYFLKVVTALLNKSKAKFLQYILVQKEGKIFDKLLNHLQHHSLAQLMVELMSVKIGVGRHASVDWDKNSDEDKAKSEEPEEELSPVEAEMTRILQQKKQEVI